jgi:hypothetical protein
MRNGNAAGVPYIQPLLLDDEPTFFPTRDFESVGSLLTVREVKFQFDREIARMARAPTPDGIDPSTRVHRVGDGGKEAVLDESKRVEKVAFPGAIPPNKEGHRSKSHVAAANALVIPDANPPQKWTRVTRVRRFGKQLGLSHKASACPMLPPRHGL